MDLDFKVPSFDVKAIHKKNKDEVKNEETPPVPHSVKPNLAPNDELEPKIGVKCPYVEPKWSKKPESELAYKFEVLKGGQIVENISDLQSRAYWSIGKMANNSIVMAHPTISRYHAILQYRPNVTTNCDDSDDSSDDEQESSESKPSDESVVKPKVEKGWYLYDLNSTHGSFVNKMKVPPKTYVRVRVGYMLKFGASTRSYILQGPEFDAEPESELTITEMKEMRRKMEEERQAKLAEEEKKREEAGISWGMAEDADNETDLSHNPYATTNNEELFLQDPKKTLRGFFEREGLDLEYKVEEVATGQYVCRVDLPIDDAMGRGITAEFAHKGKKKECVLQCALEACRILDRHGVLRQANHEPRKRKANVSDDSDDDDEFYDRTTEAQEKRKRKSGPEESNTLSYEQLLDEEKKLEAQLTDIEGRIEHYQQNLKKQKQAVETDDLDEFMSGLSSEKEFDKNDIRKFRFEQQQTKASIAKVKKLINIARPLELPPLNLSSAPEAPQSTKKWDLPLFGKKKSFGLNKPKPVVQTAKPPSSTTQFDSESKSIEEFDEDEEEKIKADKKPDKTDSSTTEDSSTSGENKAASSSSNAVTNERDINDQKDNKQFNEETSSHDVSSQQQAACQSVRLNVDDGSDSLNDVNSQAGKLIKDEPLDGITSTRHTNHSDSTQSKSHNRKKMRNYAARNLTDENEDTSPDKFSKWVPPANQSGDGMTDLNKKFGY